MCVNMQRWILPVGADLRQWAGAEVLQEVSQHACQAPQHHSKDGKKVCRDKQGDQSANFLSNFKSSLSSSRTACPLCRAQSAFSQFLVSEEVAST